MFAVAPISAAVAYLMRRDLIANVAHELRTPLASIKGYMEGMMDGVFPAGPDTYQQIYHEADRLQRLVNDLQELSRVDLAACIEPLSPSTSFLAARGLPMRWLDSHGSTRGFLAALADAAPAADVVLVHAGATDLARLFAGRRPRPVLIGCDRPEGLTHAYASMKLIAQRLGVMAFDFLLAAAADPAHLHRIADRLASCADRFIGAAVGEWAVADPACDDDEPIAPALARLAAAQLDDDAAGWTPTTAAGYGATVHAA